MNKLTNRSTSKPSPQLLTSTKSTLQMFKLFYVVVLVIAVGVSEVGWLRPTVGQWGGRGRGRLHHGVKGCQHLSVGQQISPCIFKWIPYTSDGQLPSCRVGFWQQTLLNVHHYKWHPLFYNCEIKIYKLEFLNSWFMLFLTRLPIEIIWYSATHTCCTLTLTLAPEIQCTWPTAS